jgi:hypothetical protein
MPIPVVVVVVSIAVGLILVLGMIVYAVNVPDVVNECTQYVKAPVV